MRVLVVNAGSSSLKLSLLTDHDTLERNAELTIPADGIDGVQLAGSLHGWPAASAATAASARNSFGCHGKVDHDG